MICGEFILCAFSFILAMIVEKEFFKRGEAFSRFYDARFEKYHLSELEARVEHDLLISKSLYLPISRKSFLTITLFLDKEGLQKRTD